MLHLAVHGFHPQMLSFTALLFLLFTALSHCLNNGKTQVLLNCGSESDAPDADGRRWISDSTTKFLSTPDNSITSTASLFDPALPSEVPYMSARIFNRTFSYQFPVSSSSRYWVRLHFYPTTYGSLNPFDSYFSVMADGYSLLKNFSAAVTSQALTQAFIVKEYSIEPSTNVLNITFVPSDRFTNSFAFVNGIEVSPMPDIYDGLVPVVGFSDQSMEVGSSVIESMYRVNVGGQYIGAANDSGLSRAWYDDSPYIFGAALGVTFAAPKNVSVSYPDDFPKYAAPLNLYTTARSMGPDSTINSNYNLTWVFLVDANFTYIVRLHFCELIMDKINQRVFGIYVNNKTAEVEADVIAWTGSKGVPIYKDYAVHVDDGPGDDQLFVYLHPNVASKPEYYDSILNGLEVFKVNDTNGNLAGPNPEPSEMMLEAKSNSDMEGSSPNSKGNSRVITSVAGGTTAVGLVFALCVVVYHKKKKTVDGQILTPGWLSLYGRRSHSNSSSSTISGRSCNSSHLSSLTAGLCRHFSLAEIKRGTKNFDESLVIGVGGFGKVYRGVIDGGIKVAIKRSNPQSEQGVHEFQTEIEMLSKLRHKHLVSLIGCCEENNEMILVYDYMAHGTLREHLYKSNNPPLPWRQRLEICIGSARGLHYLHTGAKYPIIHRDVKTTNILLDENLVAKVSDFGLSKTGPSLNQTHVSTVVKGSFGYLDPEYFQRQQLTDKSDVYSFGVVLFEVLCARAALNPSLPREQVSLADWALHCERKGLIENIIDPHLKGKISNECLKKFTDTAKRCLSDHGVDRPNMGDVLWNLEFALQLQMNEESGNIARSISDCEFGESNRKTDLNIGGGSATNEDSDSDSYVIFSQLVNPKGR